MTVFILTMSSINVEGKGYGIHREECYSDINKAKEQKHKWAQDFLDDYDANVEYITETDRLTEILGDDEIITTFEIKKFNVNN